jgi:2-polyprenyl-6-hydroxyphenyl methylase/3-demethylubiquinone-9 3-methyltransferase
MEKKTRYYTEKLSGERLRAAYDVAPPRARRYLEAEIDHIDRKAPAAGSVLELGCGYGRILERIARERRTLLGVDTSEESLRNARRLLGGAPRRGVFLACMDAANLGLADRSVDFVFCAQNGVSAFRVDAGRLVAEAARVTRPGGTVLFSSYADDFWDGRLEWFRAQAAAGLVGEIDEAATKDGLIVCRDGLRLGRYGPAEFAALKVPGASASDVVTVDASSVFAAWTII